ncbi:hypothetical protein TVAG_210260 [Trichomonas vaginalis G3]|uniref:Uncharacterized protein n=1 Tax=Trichomonas vaginalis (strain ATCC PRA-98 / G3) TaxID=412133 RepID=A2DVT3_TRIV3|nr:hypothetical protein TVAGG3_0734810 [Trichomonas vaginalis G3]EAY15496.1 hypothetical protein TVAG_210260 [Trichomonas vaginalis G3]KAI5511507.1 hypothetical protein TVAGG3_0734810 [Trichomonas vaginalis G3]|eukprot:XP_001327719.1 hypothetical protein [Trichomonas vaginalis G3]
MNSDGRVERCNYINNFQTGSLNGLVFVYDNKVDILDSVFPNNRKNDRGKLFYSFNGQIYIYRCNVDKYSAYGEFGGFVDTASMTTDPFSNDLKFIGLSPCEGELSIVKKKDKNDSICIDIDIISLTNLFNTSSS